MTPPDGLPRRPTLVLVANFSKPGRGTFLVAPRVAAVPSFDVVRFDAMDERGMAGPLITARALLALAGVLRAHPAATVLADTAQGLRLLRLLAPLFPRHRFVARYGNIFRPARGGWGKAAAKRALHTASLRRMDHLIVPSEASRRALVDAGLKRADQVTVVANGLAPLGAAAPAWNPDLPPALCVVGRLDDRKRPHLALEALAALRGQGTPATLDVIGNGPDRAALEARAQALGIAAHVRFHGFVPQPWEAVGANAVLLHPAVVEGFGFSVLEAIARGIPAIACAGSGGPEEIIAATDGGAIALHRTGESIAAAVRAVIADRSLGNRMALAQDAVRRLYTPQAMTAGYDAALRRIAGLPGTAAA